MIRAVILCLLLTGCSSVQRFADQHPRATQVIVASAALTVALSLDHHGAHNTGSHIDTPSVTCGQPEACK